jgi:hypothetical protein
VKEIRRILGLGFAFFTGIATIVIANSIGGPLVDVGIGAAGMSVAALWVGPWIQGA